MSAEQVEYLVVDDDAAFRAMLERALRERGVSCRSAASTGEAESILAACAVQRMILDLSMPVENGLQFLERVKAAVPMEVIILSGYGSIASATAALKCGAMNFVTKPASVDEILAGFEDQAAEPRQIAVPSLEQVEWEHLQRVLAQCEGNITKAAKLLGMHRRSLQRKLQKQPQRLQ